MPSHYHQGYVWQISIVRTDYWRCDDTPWLSRKLHATHRGPRRFAAVFGSGCERWQGGGAGWPDAPWFGKFFSV